jgi:hypothetical protein
VQRIWRGDPGPAQQDRLRLLDVCPFDRVDGIDYAQERVQSRLDRVDAADCASPAQDLLQDLGVRDESKIPVDGMLEQASRRILVRTSSSDQEHRDVGIDEDHAGPSW